jgi:7,8-dihydroneopterin 2',3'-cyclic phosphate phosphodiesterase
MEKLIKLAEKIKEKELRKKVIEFIKNPSLSHHEFKKYPKMKLEEAVSLFTVSTPQGAATVERNVIEHSIALAEICMQVADILEKNYNIVLNRDHLLAAAILHDIPKIFEWKREKNEIKHTGILLDHTMLGVAELYKRDFPEEVIHIIASHFGETGPTSPRNFEALVFHYLDSLLSLIEFHLSAPQVRQPIQLVVLDEETLKRIGSEKSEKM